MIRSLNDTAAVVVKTVSSPTSMSTGVSGVRRGLPNIKGLTHGNSVRVFGSSSMTRELGCCASAVPLRMVSFTERTLGFVLLSGRVCTSSTTLECIETLYMHKTLPC